MVVGVSVVSSERGHGTEPAMQIKVTVVVKLSRRKEMK